MIQTELNAPKKHRNEFGGFNYRKCEDILEALKPLHGKYKVVQFIDDDAVFIEGRYYIKSIVTVIDIEKPEDKVQTWAFAREPEHKTKSDDAQITGASSSYARKYALNGMYNIDDSADPDTQDNTTATPPPQKNKQQEEKETFSLKEAVIKLNKEKFQTATEAKMWRTGRGLVENLSEASDYELSKILLQLKDYKPKLES